MGIVKGLWLRDYEKFYCLCGTVTTTVSGWLWKSRGRMSCHSMDVGICPEEISPRCDANASHKRKIKKRRATKETIEPILDTTFHFV